MVVLIADEIALIQLSGSLPGWREMIRHVTFEKSTFNEAPGKFEAGTPNIAGAIGLGAAVDYLQGLGMENVAAWEAQLLAYGTEKLAIIDLHDVAIRTGHHCAMPVVEFFGLPATARASLDVYNTFEEIDILTDLLEKTIEMFA